MMTLMVLTVERLQYVIDFVLKRQRRHLSCQRVKDQPDLQFGSARTQDLFSHPPVCIHMEAHPERFVLL